VSNAAESQVPALLTPCGSERHIGIDQGVRNFAIVAVDKMPNAVSSHHSSDWLHALPLSGCGLRLDDRSIHIAVGLRLGTNICEPYQCPCGASVDARELHGLSCRGGNGHSGTSQ